MANEASWVGHFVTGNANTVNGRKMAGCVGVVLNQSLTGDYGPVLMVRILLAGVGVKLERYDSVQVYPFEVKMLVIVPHSSPILQLGSLVVPKGQNINTMNIESVVNTTLPDNRYTLKNIATDELRISSFEHLQVISVQ